MDLLSVDQKVSTMDQPIWTIRGCSKFYPLVSLSAGRLLDVHRPIGWPDRVLYCIVLYYPSHRQPHRRQSSVAHRTSYSYKPAAKGAIRCTVDNARDLHEVKDLFVCSGRVQDWRVRDLSFQMHYQRPVFVIVALNAIRQRTAGSARAYRGGVEVRY